MDIGKQKKRTTSENQRIQQSLVQVRILQKNTLYVIGVSPAIAKEDTLKRFEYFGQYGKILQVSLNNKDKAFQSENQGMCYSAYITYSSEREAAIAILSID